MPQDLMGIGALLFGRPATVREDGTMFVSTEMWLDTALPFEQQLAYLKSINDPIVATFEEVPPFR
jgi:hypothetical protein